MLYKVSNVTIHMPLKSYLCFVICLVQRGTSAVFFFVLFQALLLFPSFLFLLSTPVTLLPLVWFSLLTASLTALGSGQSSLCLLYLLSHLVKNLSGQPSDWPLGPAGDEAILILSGIPAKLVVFSSRTVAAE